MVPSETLESYFYDQVNESPLDGDVKAYLVMTLTHWATSEPDTTNALGMEYMEAHHLGPWRFRSVGDKALYLSSVRSRDRRRVVSLSYYENLGVSSYSKFAEATQSRSFWELAQCFREASGLIHELFNPGDLTELCVRAQEKGDEHAARRLAKSGVYLLR